MTVLLFAMLPGLQKVAALSSSQATHVQISGKSCVWVETSMDLWLKDTDSCKPKHYEKTPSQLHLVHHNSHGLTSDLARASGMRIN